MKTSPFKVFILFVCALITTSQTNFSQCDEKEQLKKLNKTNLGQPNSTRININNISTKIEDNGRSDHGTSDSEFFFPKGDNKTLSYTSGVLFGGYAGNLRFGGTEYTSSLLPGRILDGPVGENPNLPHVRIYRVRPDYLTSSFENEINNGEGTYEQIKEQYTKDVTEWPASDGAPYDDVNGNGTYESSIDIPGVPGAHQTIWFVANDAQRPSGHYPIATNFEIHVTVWAYNTSGPLRNVIFKKYQFINKNSFDINDMYVGIFADTDVGGSTDDFAGCDSLLGLGYAYNADSFDNKYNITPPAIGFDFLQGPLVGGNPDDVGIYNGKKVNGYKNLGTTSFVYFTCGGTYFQYPNQDIEWYKYMSGLNPETGQKFAVPAEFGGGTTNFADSGNPVTGIGWVDGTEESCGERYILLSTGPFNIAQGDTQEIVFAQLAAVGEDRLQSVAKLKELDYQIQRMYDEYLYANPKNIYAKNELEKVNAVLSENRYESTVIVDWNANQQIEDGNINGYTFQGYNVYQFRSDMALRENGIKLATYDVNDGIKLITENYYDPLTGNLIELAEQTGTDSGIQRTFTFEKDYFNDEPFIKGKTYYFGVSSYYYYPDWLSQSPLGGFRKSFESDMQLLQVTIREDESGFAYGDTIFASRLFGFGEGRIFAIVKNPSQLTGHSYKVEFDSVGNQVVWNLVDIVTGNKVLENQIIEAERYSYENIFFPSAVGMEIHVIQYKPKAAGNGNGIIEIMYGGEPIPPDGWDLKGSLYQGNCVWLDPNWEGSGNRDRYYISTQHSITGFNYFDYMMMYNLSFHDFEIRFTNQESFAILKSFSNNYYIIKVPFELWDIGFNSPNDLTDDVRMIPLFKGTDQYSGSWWASIDGELSKTTFSLEWLDPEDRTLPTISYDNFENVCKILGGDGNYYDFNFDSSINGLYAANKATYGYYGSINNFRIGDLDNDNLPPPSGTTVRINSTKPLSPSDTFIFSTYADVKEEEMPNSFVLHQNYPNPFNPSTTISYKLQASSYVTLKVYDILGREVATLVDEFKQAGIYNSEFSISQTNGRQVLNSQLSSGVYFYTLRAGDYLETKKMVLLK
ncbi:MAG: T9SS type A sorting domain-containing protein [Bacteroidota bacterium]